MSESIKKPEGWQKGKARADKTKLQIQATQIFNRVVKAAKGEIEMTSTAVRAAELVLSKTMPSLSNVEQTIVNDDDAKSQEQIMAELKALIQANPELLAQLVSVNQDKLTDNVPSQSMH